MNKQQRDLLDSLHTQLETMQSGLQDADYEGMTSAEALQAVITIEDDINTIQEQIAEMASEEREKYDNLPEGLQAAEGGEALLEAAAMLEDADSSCDDVIAEIREAAHWLQEMKDKGTEDKPVPEDDHNELTQAIADKIQSVMDYLVDAQG